MGHRQMLYALQGLAIWLRQHDIEPEQVTVALRCTSNEVREKLNASLNDVIASAPMMADHQDFVSGHNSICGLTITVGKEQTN